MSPQIVIQIGIGILIAVIGFLLKDKLKSIEVSIEKNDRTLNEIRNDMLDDYVRKEHCTVLHEEVKGIHQSTKRAHERIDELAATVSEITGELKKAS